MNMLKTIIKYLGTPNGQRNVLIIVGIILLIISLRGCGGTSDQDVLMLRQNISALTDSVRKYETKNGELVFEKAALLTKSGNLKNYNRDLAREIEDLEDKVLLVSKVSAKIVHDTMWLEPVIDTAGISFNSDSTIKVVPFDWGDTTIYAPNNYRRIGGTYLIQVDTEMNVTSRSFAITIDEIGISFTTGITENDDGLLEIFVKSPYPGFEPTAIDGALIDPRESDVIKKFFPPKRWSFGPYVGYGGYVDLSKATVGHGVNAGLSVQYGLFQWGKK